MGDFDDINVKINVDASGAEQGLTRVSTSLNKLNSDVGKLGTGADFGDKLNSEAKQAEGGLDKLGEAAEQANQKLAKVGSGLNLSAVGSQLDALSGKMQAWGAGLSILAAPFELVGAASVKAFSDFEAGMGKIFTLLPDITDQAMSEMSSQIKEFSTTFGADLSTIQQAAYDALSSGVSQADLMPFLETAQTAAVAGMSDVGTAVDGLTSAINAYQMELDDAGRVSDVFFKTVELGKIEFDELSRNIGKVAPTAAQFGISIEDTGAAIAAMTSQGVSAEETMTGLKNLFKDVATPGTQLNKIFQEIAGVTFKDFIANGGTLAEAISKLRDYSNQTGKSFFEMGSTFESANTLAMLGGGFFEKYAEMTEKVGSAAGSTESAYGKMSDTMAFALGKLKAQFQVMSVDIGKKLAPVVLEFTEWLTENTDKISDFAQSVASAAVPAIESIFDTLQRGMDMYENLSPETKSMLAKLIGVGAVGAAVAGPGLLIGGTALSPIASIVKLLGSLKVPATVATEVGAIGTAATTAEGAVGLLAGTIGTLAAAGAGVAIGAWVYDIGNFRDEVSKLPGDMAEIAEGIITALSGDSSGWGDAGKGAASLFVDGFNTGIELIKASPEVFANLFGDGAEVVGMSFTGLVDGFYQAFKDRSGETISVGKPDVSAYSKSGTEAGQSFVDAVNSFFSSNPITAPGIEAGETVAEEINRINQQVVIDQNNWLSDKKVWQSFEGNLADALISSGKQVRTFSNQSEADIWNAANEWQKAFEKSGLGFQEWLDSLNGFDAQKFKNVASDFSSTFNIELQKVYEMMSNHEIVPVKFDTSGFGNVYYEYQNGVYQPIMNNPVMIQVDEGTASGAFKSLVDQWEQVKAQIEGNPANPKINVEGSRGNLQQAWENQNAINPDQSKWQYSNEEVKLNPITGKYEKVVQQASEAGTSEGAKQGVTQGLDKWLASHGKQPSDIDAILKSPTQTAAYQKLMEKELNKEWGSQKETSSGLSVGTKQIEAANATKEETEAKKKGTKELTNFSGSLEESTDLLNTSLDKTSTSTSNLDKSVQTTGDNILNFSDPVKVATNNVVNFGPAVSSATDVLNELGSLDIKSIIQNWLGEGELGEAQSRKASDLSALYGEDVSDRLVSGLSTTISNELPKWVNWQKEDKGQSYEDVSKTRSDLWYEFANAVLKSNYAGYSDPGTRDWTFREGINSRLNPDTLKMTEELFAKSLEAYVKPFYEGKITAQPGTDYLGNQDIKNSSKYWSNYWKFVNDGLNETGTEAKTTTPQINTLNSAFEKIGLTGSGLTDVLSNVNQALSDHNANIQESQDYLKQYNDAAGENVKYTKSQEGQTKDLMNSLGMLGTAQNMYNQYMSDGVLDATESAHVQEALAAATKMMGDAGITAEGGISGLPGALQALASAAQAAMSQIQAAISQAQSAASAAASGWKMQTSPTKYPTIAPSSPTNFTVSMNGNSFPAGTKPGDVIRDLIGQLRIVA